MTNAIQVSDLSKRFRINHADVHRNGEYRTLRESLTKLVATSWKNLASGAALGDVEEFWALRDISFNVEQGDVVGIIGRNGAGKSTLLKILTRITEPTSGQAVIRGRVGSLLEVGTGFHPELTGRENVFLNGSILGMKRGEIKRNFDRIVDFSGVERFIDTPVKRYSSGMKVRLAFSIAAHLDLEVMLIDEVLAVGDAEFQKRCLGKMQAVAASGHTVLFVSHQLSAVKSLCSKAIVIENGRLHTLAPVDQAIANYLTLMTVQSGQSLSTRTDRCGNGQLRFTDIMILNSDGNPVDSVTSGDHVTLDIGYVRHQPIDHRRLIVAVNMQDSMDCVVALFSSDEMRPQFEPLGPTGRIRLTIPALLLRAGGYYIKLWASSNDTRAESVHDSVERAAEINVLPGDYWKTGARNRPGSYCVFDATMSNS